MSKFGSAAQTCDAAMFPTGLAGPCGDTRRRMPSAIAAIFRNSSRPPHHFTSGVSTFNDASGRVPIERLDAVDALAAGRGHGARAIDGREAVERLGRSHFFQPVQVQRFHLLQQIQSFADRDEAMHIDKKTAGRSQHSTHRLPTLHRQPNLWDLALGGPAGRPSKGAILTASKPAATASSAERANPAGLRSIVTRLMFAYCQTLERKFPPNSWYMGTPRTCP